jgi:hypothetical protein
MDFLIGTGLRQICDAKHGPFGLKVIREINFSVASDGAPISLSAVPPIQGVLTGKF